MTDLPATNLMMLTTANADATLDLSLAPVPLEAPRDHEVVVKVLAAPINPSDLGLLIGGADPSTARATVRDGQPFLTMDIPPPAMRAMAGRIGDALPLGNEGSGVVIAAGASPEAQALMGKTVALLGGALFAEYRTLPAGMCMEMPEGTSANDAASCFVNPLTAQAFIEVMKRDGYKGLVHTAAASNLGQMLVKLCKADGIPLVNIVRKPEQVALLKSIGATHIIDSSADDFNERLVEAIIETGAMLGFDAIGGGKLSGQILAAMEVAAVSRMNVFSRYGSEEMKQVYIYGMLDFAPTTLSRNYGFSWGLGGFLLTPFMAQAGPETMMRLRKRIADELTTTFASHYSHKISLQQALDPATLQAYNAKRTGEKYLIKPFG